MKNLLGLLGGIFITLAILMFMYGSIKTSRALDEEDKKIQLTDEVVIIQESENKDKAKGSFKIGGAILVAGIILLVMSRKPKTI